MQGLTPSFIEQELCAGRLRGQMEAVVVFADLQGFTGYTERMLALGKEGAEQLSQLLDRVFGAAATAIHGRGGFIPHFAGDAFAGVFPSDALSAALEAAGAIHQAMETLQIAIPLRIGIGRGEVMWRISGAPPHRWYLRGPGMASAVAAQQQADPGAICLSPGLTPIPSNFGWEDREGCPALSSWTLSLPLQEPNPPHPQAGHFFPGWLQGHLQGGEFRTVTSMFLSLDGNPADATLENWLVGVCHRLERYRAYIKEMDFTDKGPLLVAFFGAPVSAGDSRRQAVEAALAVMNMDLSCQAGLHIGLATGPSFCGLAGNAYRRQYIVAGRSVNLAARLAMRGQPGQVLCDPITLEGLPASIRPLGSFPAKGFAEPVVVSQVDSLDPTPEDEGISYRTDSLTEYLARDLLGAGTSILQINGEPGMGKTFVARSLTRHTASRLVWLEVEGQQIRPGAFQALEDAWADLRDFPRAALIEADLERLRTMRQREDLPPRERFTFLEQLHRQLLSRSLGHRKVGVWVEHWDELDQDSRALLLEVAGRGDLSLLITSRSPSKELEDHHAQCHHLEGLDQAGMHALVRRVLDASPAPALTELLLRTTSGNPFYAGQLLLYLRDHGLLQSGEDGGVTVQGPDIPLGDSLRDILLARLDQLEPALRQLLRVAAVIGPRFEEPLLSEVVRETTSEPLAVREALAAALEADMLRIDSQGQYVFLHSLLREVLYDLQLASRLQTLHLAILSALERLAGEHPDLRAMASHAARAGEAPQALHYYRLAARRAMDAYQNREALLLFEEALAFAVEDRARAGLILDRHAAALALGMWREAREWLENPVFRGGAEPVQRASRSLAQGQVLLLTGDYAGAMASLNQGCSAFEALGDPDGMARCTRELSILHFRQGDYTRAEEYITRTFGLLSDRRSGDPALVVNLALIRMNQGRYTEAEQLLYEELLLRLQTGEQQPLPILYVNLGVVQNEMGHYPQAMEHLEKGLAIAEEAGSRLWVSIALGTRGMVWENTGQWARALSDYEADLELARALGDPQGTAIAEELLGSLLVRKGEFEKGSLLLHNALETCRRLGYRKGWVKCLLSLGESRFWQDDLQGAEPLLREALDIAGTMSNRRLMALAALALANLHLDRGERLEAQRLWESGSEDVLTWEDPALWRQWMAVYLGLAEGRERLDRLEHTIAETTDPWLRAEARRLRWEVLKDPADLEFALRDFKADFLSRPYVMTHKRILQLENA